LWDLNSDKLRPCWSIFRLVPSPVLRRLGRKPSTGREYCDQAVVDDADGCVALGRREGQSRHVVEADEEVRQIGSGGDKAGMEKEDGDGEDAEGREGDVVQDSDAILFGPRREDSHTAGIVKSLQSWCTAFEEETDDGESRDLLHLPLLVDASQIV
jgi:hypothetical protein